MFEFDIELTGLDLVNRDRRDFDSGRTPVRLSVRDASWGSWLCHGWCFGACSLLRCCGQRRGGRRPPNLIDIEFSRIRICGNAGEEQGENGPIQAAPPAVNGGGPAAAPPEAITATVRLSMEPHGAARSN